MYNNYVILANFIENNEICRYNIIRKNFDFDFFNNCHSNDWKCGVCDICENKIQLNTIDITNNVKLVIEIMRDVQDIKMNFKD